MMNSVKDLPFAKPLKPLLQAVVLSICLLAACTKAPERITPSVPAVNVATDSISLFDGETFAGWDGVNSFFSIEEGSIVAGALDRPVPQNEFLCTTERFGDFRLSMEVRLVGKDSNAGIQLRTERIPDSNEVIGYQADMGIGWWGSLYDEMRRKRLLATADAETIERVLDVDGWNTYEMTLQGPRVQLWLNGTQTVDFTEPDPSIPADGHICVQIHSGPPGQAWYRSIWLQRL